MPERLYKTATLTTPPFPPANPPNFQFNPVPQGSAYTGTVQILNAPAYAFHQAFIAGILWAEWFGFQPSPVLQAIGGEVLQIQSALLNTSTQYQAVWIGTVDDENSYIPVWPEASVTPLLPQSTAIAETVMPNGNTSPFSTNINTGVPGQVLAIQINPTGGTATGFRLSVTAGNAGVYVTTYPQDNANLSMPWWFVPIQDTTTTIQVEPILNNVAGGTYGGILRVAVIPGPLYTPVLQNGWDIAITPQGAIGRQVELTVAAGATGTLLAEPQTGTIYHVKFVSVFYTAAPATVQALVIRGTQGAPGGLAYWRGVCPTAVGMSAQSGPWDAYIGGTPRMDPAEGLTATNNASTQAIFVLNYDIEAYPQGYGLY